MFFFIFKKTFEGGSENVNYAVQIFMALLVKTGIVDEVYCNRLPPR